MLLVELKPIIDSLDAEKPLVSGKIMAGELANVKPVSIRRRIIYGLV
jgi:hypothetical protein